MSDQAHVSQELSDFVDAHFVKAGISTKSSDLQVCHAYIAFAAKTLANDLAPDEAVAILQGYIDAIKSGALISRS